MDQDYDMPCALVNGLALGQIRFIRAVEKRGRALEINCFTEELEVRNGAKASLEAG